MDSNMNKEQYSNTKTKKGFKVSGSQSSIINNPCKQEKTKYKKKRRSDKSPFFSKSSKNKICLIFRQKPQFRLATLANSLAKHFAGTNGYSRLISIVAGPPNISERMSKRNNTSLLIWSEDKHPQYN